ncbi:Trk system potassium uptake protein [Candidatus Terasakiella magnetica]|uniref:Trk system potassium uptake protein n=1 Tax=Candidatus Terasakiella magnetica TaxID=1867952 RepID=A0A1C3RM18_9PROT|nr:TrkH family potassium uptake protein [Candidatus Terasakiella magnetica]SCA58316.1 Trk system potassium uptake protein [Candidatus Terasakiella magnetica]
MKIDLRPIYFIIGLLLMTLALGMLLPMFVDLAQGNPDWQVFMLSSGVTIFIASALILAGHTREKMFFSIRQGFIMATFSWLVMTIFAALPFAFSELDMSYTDAFFEAMSGITTTGSTVITGLDYAPPGLLLWRALLQWLGGIGIIVMAVAIMPMLHVGGMQLFKVEAFETSDKALPKAAQISASISAIYVGLTAIWAIGLWLAGMTPFEAVNHAMTTIATGGFSTSDGSIGHFNSGSIDLLITLGMIVGSLPFMLYLRMLRGNFQAIMADTQVQWFLVIVFLLIFFATAFLWIQEGYDPIQSLRFGAFNVVSIITGTGYASMDYQLWGHFAWPIFFFIMFIGGCSGSTTCGIKIFRFQVLYAAAETQIKRLLEPHGVFIPYYNRRPIPDEVMFSVLGFFFIFGVCFALLAMALGMMGLDYITAISSAATALANVGPALGDTAGPSGNFQTLPDGAKWLMASGMLLGRLELFTILVLFMPTFWRG